MLKFSRRFLLNRAAALPAAAALASVPALAAPISAVPDDPIFAAITAHKHAIDAYEAKFGLGGNADDLEDAEYHRQQKALNDAEWKALHDLMLVRPTTVAGIIAVLDHVGIPAESLSWWQRDRPCNWLKAAYNVPSEDAAIIFLPAVADALREMAEAASLPALSPRPQSATAITTSAITERDQAKDAKLFELIERYEAATAEENQLQAIEQEHEIKWFARRKQRGERAIRRSSAHVVASRNHRKAINRSCKLMDEITEMPARTWRGVVAKARIAQATESPDVAAAAVDDTIALADVSGIPGGVS